jgi:hypothetical protein
LAVRLTFRPEQNRRYFIYLLGFGILMRAKLLSLLQIPPASIAMSEIGACAVGLLALISAYVLCAGFRMPT